MQIRNRGAAARCAYCHDLLSREAVTCTECGTLVHEDCQSDTCPTLGCGSLQPWAWIELAPTHGARRSRGRLWRVAALIPLALVALWTLRPARTQELAVLDASPGSALSVAKAHPNPWFALEPGSQIETRTIERWAHYSLGFACGNGPCEAIHSWSYSYEDRSESYSLRVVGAEEALVRRRGGKDDPWRGENLEVPRRAAQQPGQPHWSQARRVLEERRGVVIEVPAGTFTCTYRKEAGYTYLLLPGVFETWTVPELPFPVLEIETWQDPTVPATHPNCKRTELTRVAVTPASSTND